MEEGQRLLERILDGDKEPTDLPLALLKGITNDFSEERKIGQGGFGAVYKGVLEQLIVAVKRININGNTFDDNLFFREFVSVRNTNHRNVVRFLGFCSNTYQKMIESAQSRETILSNVLERLLCFEYIPNGSLDTHITDELRGLEWETRYGIITGICKGLCYLHEDKKIIHMDLKPANILLHNQDDKYMVPKITDFGLSRTNEKSHTVTRFGTLGYMAPEYVNYGKTTFMSDIYSLGAIIIEIVTGCKDVPNKDNVLRRWRHRWNEPLTQLQYQQVTRCIFIAGRCREEKPEARPSIKEIISFLNESESTYGQISPLLDEDDMLRIKPLELRLPSELNKEIARSIELTNGTRKFIAFNIQLPNPERYSVQSVKGIMRSGSKYDVKIIVQARDVHRCDHDDKFIVQSMKASEGLSVAEITEHMFRPEAGKVVDEVDLMVVYEPAKPQENYKRRKDTSMPVEEVPEAKKRKIVESSTGKGKKELGSSENPEEISMDINSSACRQCVGQIEQCNLHQLQSFSRHYPTNRKYLGNKSPAVDHTRGAMGSLLDKLGKLVTVDYSLDTRIKSDINSFSVQLQKIHLELPKLKSIDGAEVLVDEVRELSYNIEDIVDSFLVHVESDSSSCGFKEIMHESVKLLVNGKTIHHQIGDVIIDIKEKVEAVVHMKEEYNFNVNDIVANATEKAAIYPRMAVYRNKEQLVGIEVPRDEIIVLFEKGGDVDKQELRIVSIVGLGGLGKTTLAKAVYEEFKGYNPKAFVSVGQNPNPITILKKIICDCRGREYSGAKLEHLDVGQLSDELHDFLKDKRYFIVIDDLWGCELWDTINFAFPRDKCGSRVITTTRIQEVIDRESWSVENQVYRIKPLSDEYSTSLFHRRISGLTPRKEEISKDILKKCGGMPLAINSIASHLARHPSESSWEHVRKSVGAIKGNDIEKMKKILDLSYIHLPDHLKTCLLHVCMYPEDRNIKKNVLLRKWVAEGFVSTDGGQDPEDVAEEYFKALIDMFMIQPWKIDYNNEILSCRVHDIILELMRSKSSEENFIHVLDGLKDVSGQIRRVSVQYNDEEDSRILETIKGSLSRARSVLLYRASLLPDFLKYKYVRVLHLVHKVHYNDSLDLTGISGLFLLRYLKIASYRGSNYELKLPDQIGQLEQLETIDLKGGEPKNYPSDIVTLPQLSHLRHDGWITGIMLPDGIERLKSLHTLEGVCLTTSSVESIKGLGELTNLRNLEIRSVFTSELEELESAHMNALHSSISRLSTSLRILTLERGLYSRHGLSRWSSSLFPPGSHIQKLHLKVCVFERCPQWIGQLHYLYSLSINVTEVADCISIVGGLPSLAYFYLRFDNFNKEKEENIVISGSGAFQALKHLILESTKRTLTFEERAMPKLERLYIPFRHNTIRRLQYMPVGIQHLPAPTLKEICLRVSTERDDWKVKGSEHWNNHDWKIYWDSDHYADKIKEHSRKTATLLKRELKSHHPSADIYIIFANYEYSDSEDVDEENYEEDGDKEHDDDSYDHEELSTEDYDFSEKDEESIDDEEANESASQVNGSQTSA